MKPPVLEMKHFIEFRTEEKEQEQTWVWYIKYNMCKQAKGFIMAFRDMFLVI